MGGIISSPPPTVAELKTALEQEDFKVLKKFIDRGGDINMYFGDNDRRTPLSYVLYMWIVPVLDFLVQAKADLNKPASISSNLSEVIAPILHKLEDKHIVFLVENGADLTVKDGDGRTPLKLVQLWHAKRNDYPQSLALLTAKGAPCEGPDKTQREMQMEELRENRRSDAQQSTGGATHKLKHYPAKYCSSCKSKHNTNNCSLCLTKAHHFSLMICENCSRFHSSTCVMCNSSGASITALGCNKCASRDHCFKCGA